MKMCRQKDCDTDHYPIPWEIWNYPPKQKPFILDDIKMIPILCSNGDIVAYTPLEDVAERINTAVNCHADLLAACEELCLRLEVYDQPAYDRAQTAIKKAKGMK